MRPWASYPCFPRDRWSFVDRCFAPCTIPPTIILPVSLFLRLPPKGCNLSFLWRLTCECLCFVDLSPFTRSLHERAPWLFRTANDLGCVPRPPRARASKRLPSPKEPLGYFRMRSLCFLWKLCFVHFHADPMMRRCCIVVLLQCERRATWCTQATGQAQRESAAKASRARGRMVSNPWMDTNGRNVKRENGGGWNGVGCKRVAKCR